MGKKGFFKMLDRPVDEILAPEKRRTPDQAAALWLKRKAFWKKWGKLIVIAPLLFTVFISILVFTHGLFLSADVKSWVFVLAMIVLCGYFLAALLYVAHIAHNPKDPYEIPLYSEDPGDE